MLQPPIETALNQQFNQEQTAAQEYLAMAAWCEHRNLRGFAAFMRHQSDEERVHALKLLDHVVERGGRANIQQISAPESEFNSPLDLFRAALERERTNTRSINALYALAAEHNDYATQTFLHWFITEQVEEEQWGVEAVALLEMAGDNRSALMMLDHRYGEMETS